MTATAVDPQQIAADPDRGRAGAARGAAVQRVPADRGPRDRVPRATGLRAVQLDAGGDSLVGYKLGLTSRNKQRAMGVDAPLYGRVTSGMLATYGEPVRFDRFIHPRVESEIAFLLARDVAAPATVTSVLAATDVVFGAVDVLDSRYEEFRFSLDGRRRRQRQRRGVLPRPDRAAARESRPAPARVRRAGGRGCGHDRGRRRGDGPPGGLGRLARQPARPSRESPSRQAS